MKTLSQIEFQQNLINRMHSIELNGVGDHRPRSRARACANARKLLMSRGYTEPQANVIVNDARDMWQLESICDE